MEMGIVSGREAGIFRGDEIEAPVAEHKLWVAVLAQALEDWEGDRLHARRDAEQFLFHDKNDFFTVCTRAGVDGSSLRSRLSRLQRPAASMRSAPLAA
ncbi:MAG TPA: hypothetical protein VN745_03345 [Verrucomicrobiae bacterium]|nr:hypothetical protein [Verrucomicrobiae bacterium]